MKIEINNDESIFILNGVEYEAKYAESCKGCAFVNPKNNECFFAGANITKCMRMYRKDSQSIQWIRKSNLKNIIKLLELIDGYRFRFRYGFKILRYIFIIFATLLLIVNFFTLFH